MKPKMSVTSTKNGNGKWDSFWIVLLLILIVFAIALFWVSASIF